MISKLLILVASSAGLMGILDHKQRRAALLLAASGIIAVQAWFIAPLDKDPVNTLFSATALFAAFCIIFYALAALIYPLSRLRYVMSIPFLLALIAWALWGGVRFSLDRIDIEIHALLSLAAYAALANGCAQATSSARLQQRIKRSPLDESLPALDRSDQATYALLRLAWLLLSTALISGAISTIDLLAQHVFHKTVLSIVAWLSLTTLLLGHYRLGWRGKAAYRWVSFSFAALILGYFGSRLAISLIAAN